METANLFDESGFSVFFFMTVVIGGGAAFLAGRSLAHKWRPLWQAVAYMLLLGLALRFFHYALFGANLLSALLLCRGHPGSDRRRLSWLSHPAYRADDDPIQLDIRTNRTVELARKERGG